MVGLYKDPKGEEIFWSTPVPSSLAGAKEYDASLSNSENPGLRKRIRELEEEVKEMKDVRSYVKFSDKPVQS